jgi:hypothetical protein
VPQALAPPPAPPKSSPAVLKALGKYMNMVDLSSGKLTIGNDLFSIDMTRNVAQLIFENNGLIISKNPFIDDINYVAGCRTTVGLEDFDVSFEFHGERLQHVFFSASKAHCLWRAGMRLVKRWYAVNLNTLSNYCVRRSSESRIT